ncbi:cytochrome c peroxidase [Aequorivita sp. SDUM287046]|uniref:Cytochrome c peroxidase n=1 Tax=Aequorivita aurantiaca TaxID=3053356 RepID=A0ABT8DD30_9FLAO|nr:cytochrome c peroxidase [Aequorivita aurantiaca]MDN3722898.1 cytochrome c peroxidase [Aequorivita aurantiaca]
MKKWSENITRTCIVGLAIGFMAACSSNDSDPVEPIGENEEYIPTPKALTIPPIFQQLLPPPYIPADNPQTVEGVALGRKLFYDPILSGDGTQACASCHQPANSFSDSRKLSIGIDGFEGIRNSMPIYNMAWNTNEKFFWDGRAVGLELQSLDPVTNPVEMHNTWENAVASLQGDTAYPELYLKAFGTSIITKELTAKAIAQFERTFISANSPFDRYLMGENTLTQQEINGFAIFMDEARGDCFHCHGNEFNPLWTDNAFHNNGLDAIITDKGLGNVSGDPNDDGKFKSPSLRNLAYTAPYMHDGRFATLDDVINHYSEGLVYSRTIDPLMKAVSRGGVQLTESDKSDLKAFLLSLSDSSFITNPDLQDPN